MSEVKWQELLSNGTLRDNQSYRIFDSKVVNSVSERNVCELKSYNRSPHVNELYDFLIKASSTIKQEVAQGKVELFDKNKNGYEHNTRDNICTIEGYSCNDFVIHTGNLIGSIVIDGKRLTISSRFGDRFLKYIIADADGFLEIKDNGAYDSKNAYQWLILYLWRIKLQKAFRLGIPKAYTSKDDVLPKMRGNIDLVHYELNKDLAKYHCTYIEHSYNNRTTQLIATVFDRFSHENMLLECRNIRNAFMTAVDGTILRERRQITDIKHFTNPYYYDYNIVIDLSKRLLKDESLDFGDNSNCNGYLFDVSMLFEYFVRKQISRSGLTMLNKETEFSIPRGGARESMDLYPDLVFQNDKHTYVFDVKYKRYDPIYGVKREDLFQIHTYLGQYSNKYDNIAACGFVFPMNANRYEELKEGYPQVFNDSHTIKNTISFANKKVDFFVVFLLIPNANTADDYNETFSKYCETFRQDIKKICSSSAL